MFANFFFMWLLAKQLGSHGIGLFSLTLTITAIVSTLTTFGYPVALTKLIAVDKFNNDYQLIQSRLSWTVLRVSVFSCSMAIFLIAASGTISRSLFSSELTPILRAGAFAILPISLIQIMSGFSRGLDRPSLAMALQFLLPYVLASVLFTALGESNTSGIYSYLSATVLTCVCGLLVLVRPWEVRLLTSDEKQSMNIIAIPMLWTSSTGLLLGWADTLMLGYFSTPATVGLYAIAFRFSLISGVSKQVVNAIMSPKLATTYHRGDLVEQQAVLTKAAKLSFYSAAPVMIIILIFAEPILLAFGDEFIEAAIIVRIIVLGELLSLYLGSAAMAMQMTGLQNELRKITMVALVLNILANLILIPSLGAVGAALATAATNIGQRVWMVNIVKTQRQMRTALPIHKFQRTS